jgi:hypothetical protein
MNLFKHVKYLFAGLQAGAIAYQLYFLDDWKLAFCSLSFFVLCGIYWIREHQEQ